jgi:hypothetical protein
MNWKLPIVFWTMSTNPTKPTTTTSTTPSVAATAVPSVEPPPTITNEPFKGIEVIQVPDKNKPGETNFAIQIHPIECLKFLTKWMKEYNVMGTLKEWAAQVDWKAQVWTPLKDWSKEQDWKKLRKEVKEGLDEVDWKQVKKDVKDDLQTVDWKQVRKDVKDSLNEVDWKEVRQERTKSTGRKSSRTLRRLLILHKSRRA